MDFIQKLIEQGWLKSQNIIQAFQKIKRHDFLPEDMKDLDYLDQALPIGFGQTISQPLVVAFMLEQLNPQSGDKILDIGAGSGWTSALLAEIVGSQGRIIAIEIVPALKELGEKNVNKYNFIENGTVKFICADGSKGYPEKAPFNRILASASGKELPLAWKQQLKIGGRIVAPIKNSIWTFIKKSASHQGAGGGEFEQIEHPGFAFVPLITEKD